MNELDSPGFFGEWLKQRRNGLDLTQAELAESVGCSVFALRKIESGERRPSKQLARLLAQALELPPQDHDTFVRAARGEAAADRLAGPAHVSVGKPLADINSIPRVSTGWPVTLNPLVGREPELAALDRLLRDPLCRLLTLIGAGGIGKTRLAIEFSSRHQEFFDDGVWFVPLASISSSAFLVQAIADAIGLVLQGQIEPRHQLFNHLQDKQALLVLDNAEHLLDGVRLFAEILACAPQIKLVVTSRERLSLQAEWVYVIQGLPVPPADQIERAADYASVQLFVQSARRAFADFRLLPGDRPAVVRICELVEGMPLGIELAAAWITTLTCEEIAGEIRRSLDFLVTSVRDVPDRQRSLRAVFDHSWNLLSAAERAVLSRLAIFQGGFRREAADEVAGATLPLLYALVSKSLLRHDETGRYDLHEVVRQYAVARLAEVPEYAAICDKHSQYYLSLLRDREDDLKGAAQREAIRELKAEIDNMRTAWAWAVRHEQFELLHGALRSFGWLCNVGVLYREGIEQLTALEKALRTQPGDHAWQHVLGTTLAQQGLLYFRSGQFGPAMAAFEESLAVHRPLGDPTLMIDALVVSGVILHLNGELDKAQERLVESVTYARGAEDESLLAYALFNLGYVASLRGHYSEGYEQMQAGLALWRELGDPSAIALGLNHISLTAIHLGRAQEAQVYLLESIDLLTQVGDRWGLGTAYRYLGLVELALGDIAAAQAHICQSLDCFRGFIIGWDVARSLTCLGRAKAAAGDLCEARHFYLEALREAKEAHAIPLSLDVLLGLSYLYLWKHEAEMALRLALCIIAHQASTHEVRQGSTEVCARAEEDLTPEQVDSAREWTANHSLAATIDLLLTSSSL